MCERRDEYGLDFPYSQLFKKTNFNLKIIDFMKMDLRQDNEREKWRKEKKKKEKDDQKRTKNKNKKLIKNRKKKRTEKEEKENPDLFQRM